MRKSSKAGEWSPEVRYAWGECQKKMHKLDELLSRFQIKEVVGKAVKEDED